MLQSKKAQGKPRQTLAPRQRSLGFVIFIYDILLLFGLGYKIPEKVSLYEYHEWTILYICALAAQFCLLLRNLFSFLTAGQVLWITWTRNVTIIIFVFRSLVLPILLFEDNERQNSTRLIANIIIFIGNAALTLSVVVLLCLWARGARQQRSLDKCVAVSGVDKSWRAQLSRLSSSLSPSAPPPGTRPNAELILETLIEESKARDAQLAAYEEDEASFTTAKETPM